MLTLFSGCDAPSFEEASFDQQVGRLSPGDKLKLRCNEDYKEMDTFVTCQRNGTWSDPDPECQREWRPCSNILRTTEEAI